MPGCVNSLLVAGISMADNTEPRVSGEYALKALSGFRCAVSYNDLASVLAEANSDAATVME